MGRGWKGREQSFSSYYFLFTLSLNQSSLSFNSLSKPLYLLHNPLITILPNFIFIIFYQSPSKMDKQLQVRRLLLLSNKLSSLRSEYQPTQINNVAETLQPKKMLSSQKVQQAFPSISSQYLKNTVLNMFSLKHFQQNQPSNRQFLPQETIDRKIPNSKRNTQPLVQNYFSCLRQDTQKMREVQLKQRQFTNQHLIPKKVTKSYSQAKKSNEFSNPGYGDLKMSLQINQDFKRKGKTKSSKYSRANTEQSQQNEESSSKAIFRKLEELNQKQSFRATQMKQSTINKGMTKELKSPGFVMRQKLSKQMYGEEREQLRMLTRMIENEKGLNMSKGIKVKNYTKFLPQIMTIQD